MTARHADTGEWMPEGGFPRLPEPDCRELRPTLAAAKLLGVVPSYMGRVAEKWDLTVFETKINGGVAYYYLLEEILEVKARARFGQPQTALTAQPETFKVKRARGGDQADEA